MRVLHLWKSDHHGGGGGAIVMSRLHSSLRESGIDSKILCKEKTTDSPHVAVTRRWHRLELLLREVTSRLGLNDVHAVSSFRIPQHEAYKQSDILNIHGTHSEFISYLALPWLTRNKPAVFTLHDVWGLTGHCAINYDCERWKIGCGKCPYPDAYPPIRRDGTRIEWKLKNWAYSHSNLTIVAPSRWLTEQAKQSMLKRFPIHWIPHGVDTQVYQPLDPAQCRSLLGIGPRKKVLMFSGLSLRTFHKGGDLLREALQGLPESLKAQIVLLFVGYRGEAIAESVDVQTLNLGYISSDRIRAICYSAADLFVHPTRAEAFGLVLVESMACGTPCVSFRVGGVPDIVRPGITGYLAERGNAKDFREGIVQLLEDERLRKHMGQKCREIAREEYSIELQTERYIQLYRQVLETEPRVVTVPSDWASVGRSALVVKRR